ncbi:GNAT family N-acetyltransferase [Enterococcus sp. UD-01]|jgi:GNAT superfamily N-acetyltransferase|uniref:GNAT family N-acetyltransferase n=1 Tax=Enterococcus sp. UD-01 TaxID=3373911 RepID=UPI003838DDB7
MLEFKQLTLAENEKRLIALLSEQQEAEKKVPAEENTSFSCALYEDGHYIGGITANKWMNTTHISLLALNKEARSKGYGTKLLQKAEAFAADCGSSQITIHTQDYQAKAFYEKFGYRVFGQLADTPFAGTTKYYLVKQLLID